MRDNRPILMLSLAMAVVAFGVGLVTIYMLYQTAFDQQRQRLVDAVEGRAAFAAAVARHDRRVYDDPSAAERATLSQLHVAQQRFSGFGETGEFNVGRLRDGEIELLLGHRHEGDARGATTGAQAPLAGCAEPMRRAVNGGTGTLVARDYRDVPVLAAYVYVPDLDAGIVAKIDLAELRAPFFRAGLYAGAVALLLILVGVILVRRIGDPLVRKLERSELYFRTLVQHGSDVLCDLDPDGRVRHVSESVDRLLGRTAAALAGEGLFAHMHPDDRDQAREVLKSLAQRPGTTEKLRFRFRHSDGDWRVVEAAGASMITNPAVQGLVVSMRDVTERERLREEVDRFFRISRDLHSIASSEGHFRRVNASFSRVLGYRTDEIIGMHFAELLHPDDLEESLAWLHRVVDGEVAASTENRYRCSDGSYRWLAWHGERGADGLIYSAARDVTAQKETEAVLQQTLDELRRSNEELEQFAYVASHDLQEPLRMVASYTQLLARRYGEQLDDDATDFIAFAVDGAERMQVLIRELLAYSRVGTRGDGFEPASTQTAVASALRDLQALVDEAGASIHVDALPDVVADQGQLVRVFQNLIANALRYRGDAPPEILVEARRAEDEWHFTVRDNGIGIDPKHHDRVFVIFQRLHTREEYPGTGMGLAITKKIIERHGGRIWIESEPGRGTAFHFTIPITTTAPSPHAVAANGRHAAAITPAP